MKALCHDNVGFIYYACIGAKVIHIGAMSMVPA